MFAPRNSPAAANNPNVATVVPANKTTRGVQIPVARRREFKGSQMQITENHELISSILELGTFSDGDMFRSALVRVGRKLGFESVLYGGQFAIDGTQNTIRIESNYQSRWLETYHSENYFSLDPIVAHAMHSHVPILWSDTPAPSPAQQRFWEEAAGYGLVGGVSFPMQTRGGDVGILSFAMDKNGRDAQAHINANMMWGPMIATMSQEAMRRIVGGKQAQLRPRLTRREGEILRWLAAGKSTGEISVILSISEHGVVYHVRNLLHKFATRTRGQTVIKAMSLGML